MTKHGEPMRWLVAHLGYQGDDCVKWPYARTQAGYAVVAREDGSQTTAHRVMAEMLFGPPSSPSIEVAHSCGKGHEGCLNPKHLRWATHVENCADRKTHGTHRTAATKLSGLDVAAIREIAPYMPVPAIAAHYGVTKYHVYSVISGRRWSD